MPDNWRRHERSWWPAFLPWLGVETLTQEEAVEIGLPARGTWRVLSVEWFWRGLTLAAWRKGDA